MLPFPEFHALATLAQPHLMTLASFFLPRRWRSAAMDALESRRFRIDADNEVMARCHWQPDRRRAATLIVVHGLSGGADSPYMIGTADKAYLAGFNVLRLNLRNCGGTEDLCVTLYHSGMSEDLLAVMRELRDVDGLRRIHLAGFSMGGNIVLRVVGRLPEDLRPVIGRCVAVSPALDLARAVDNIDSGRLAFVYRNSFLRHLRGLYRRKARDFPQLFDPTLLRGIRTIYEFDDRITSKHFGFGDAPGYYRTATALPLLASIVSDTLIIQSKDDPLVPCAQLEFPGIVDNPKIATLVTRRGGHCAFIARSASPVASAAASAAGSAATGLGEGYRDVGRFWAENRLVQFLAAAPETS